MSKVFNESQKNCFSVFFTEIQNVNPDISLLNLCVENFSEEEGNKNFPITRTHVENITPLFLGMAIRKNLPSVAIKLIQNPLVDINKIITIRLSKVSPIFYSISKDLKSVVSSLLLREDLDIDVVYNGFSVLGWCINKGKKEIFDMLLDYPLIDVNKRFLDWTPLAYTIFCNERGFLEKLLECDNLDLDQPFGRDMELTPLLYSIYSKNNKNASKLLIEHNANLDVLIKEEYLRYVNKKKRENIIITQELINNHDLLMEYIENNEYLF
eukprot:TRINITY_DN1378_c0_g4_i1.p1 TRINITY_DN1378_c0_g4~~TRINITY_DN1378_c0_g4_i1.p1  ORF type:complete len:268 (+),score=24.76 TRINITY_DN1378_c0_g4_i1:79-882(+)